MPAAAEPIARYNPIAMTFHWLVAALILLNIYEGLLAKSYGDNPAARPVIDLHKSIGLTVLGLVILRILWRLARRPPPLPRTYSRLEQRAAHVAHVLLYVLMLALPLTGYIHDSAFKAAAAHPLTLYGLVHVPRLPGVKTLEPATKEAVHSAFYTAHVALGYFLYALLALHIAGVVKHHAIDREAELQRMLPGGARRLDEA